jgi:RNA polymerase sigma-70 factor (ECF subfamily)
MASSFQGVFETAGIFAPAVTETQKASYSEIYNEHCHRIYSLSFWMTDHELVAEELSANTFLRAFALSAQPSREDIDRAFLKEVREITPVGVLTLSARVSDDVAGVRRNMKRVHLERAVVQLPATEKLIFLMHDVEGYQHDEIARLLGITSDESKCGLHQARVEIREMVARMS